MDHLRIIFEKGITIENGKDGLWSFQHTSESGDLKQVLPQDVIKKYNVNPVLLVHLRESGENSSYLQNKKEKMQSLDLGVSEIDQHELMQSPDMHKLLNLSYVVGGLVYHCKRLASLYSNTCHIFTSTRMGAESSVMNFAYSSAPYYEFDALITSARRSYDTTRYIIWKYFSDGGSMPSSFARTIPKCTKLPTSLAQRLELSWASFGEELTNYRDCIHHYVPLDFGLSYAHMEKLKNGIWSTSFFIPDNPEAKSKNKFTFTLKKDALSYGWEVTNEILEVCKEILDAAKGRIE